jgi:hypothetical protein
MAFFPDSNTYFTQYLKIASNGNVEMMQYVAGNLYGKVKLLCAKCKDERVFEANLFANAAVPFGLEEFVKKHRHDSIIVKAKPTDNWVPGKVIPFDNLKSIAPATSSYSYTSLKTKLAEMEAKVRELEAQKQADKKVEAPEAPKGRRFRE